MANLINLGQAFSANRLSRLVLPVALAACAIITVVNSAWIALRYGVSPLSLVIALAWALALVIIALLAHRDRLLPMVPVLIGAVVASRIAMMLAVDGQLPLVGDPLAYAQLATSLLSGEGYIWHSNSPIGDLRAHMPPLYPVLLAGVQWLTGSPFAAVALLNSIVDIACAYAVYRTVRGLASADRALGAAVVYLLWPRVVSFSMIPNKEGLALLFLVCLVGLIVQAVQNGAKAKNALYFGMTAGLLALTQPAWVVLVALLSIPLAVRLRWKGLLQPFGFAALGFVIVMAPWWVRNWLAFSAFVPLTTSGSLNFYINTMQTWTLPPQLAAMSETERLPYLFSLAMDWVKDHPVEYLIAKLKAGWIALGSDHAIVEVLESLHEPFSFPTAGLAFASQASLFLMWVGGLGASIVRSTDERVNHIKVFLLCGFLNVAVFALWFEFGQRHRLYFLPLVLILFFTTKLVRRSDPAS